MLTIMKGAKGFRGLKKDEIQEQANLYIQTMTVSPNIPPIFFFFFLQKSQQEKKMGKKPCRRR